MTNKIEAKLIAATSKAMELISTGSTEVWSSQLGDLTKKQFITVLLRLNNTGFKVQHITNSYDNGFVVVKK
jgi:hypothetical protein